MILIGTQLFILFKMHVKGVLTLVVGILIHLTLGTLYTASNLSTYVISYLHVVKNQKVYVGLLHYFIGDGFIHVSLGLCYSIPWSSS